MIKESKFVYAVEQSMHINFLEGMHIHWKSFTNLQIEEKLKTSLNKHSAGYSWLKKTISGYNTKS